MRVDKLRAGWTVPTCQSTTAKFPTAPENSPLTLKLASHLMSPNQPHTQPTNQHTKQPANGQARNNNNNLLFLPIPFTVVLSDKPAQSHKYCCLNLLRTHYLSKSTNAVLILLAKFDEPSDVMRRFD